MIKVTVWNEFRHEKTKGHVKAIYPNGLHAVIADFLGKNEDISVRLAALDDEYQGLPDDVLEDTDVLIWWGHMAHKEVDDELVKKIQQRVYLGKMGLIALHSGHHSKVFKAVIGTNGNLQWGREQKEIIWNVNPGHPICAGIPDHFLIESEEVYSEPFFIPEPDALLFIGWFEDGNVFRSGACFNRGAGKVFYFQPGHESCRSFYNPYVQKIITNGVYWAAPNNLGFDIEDKCPHMLSPTKDEFNA
ncbi:MAG: ThuA domain-containing protein [Clostridia bacterium]|nr:ThuA domain-containing protein [Clostridia bacterium]